MDGLSVGLSVIMFFYVYIIFFSVLELHLVTKSAIEMPRRLRRGIEGVFVFVSRRHAFLLQVIHIHQDFLRGMIRFKSTIFNDFDIMRIFRISQLFQNKSL